MTKKTMSGLSLALMNDCNISRTPNYSGTPPTGPQYAMRSGDAGRISFNSSKNPSPRSLSSTPPFGASPGVLSGLNFPTTISSTPPFRMGSHGSNRESIYIPVSFRHMLFFVYQQIRHSSIFAQFTARNNFITPSEFGEASRVSFQSS